MPRNGESIRRETKSLVAQGWELIWQQANMLEILDDGNAEKLIGAGCTNIKMK